MKSSVSDITKDLIISSAVFALVAFIFTYTLQDEIYFSLFVGIPAGFSVGFITLVLLMMGKKKGRKAQPMKK